jgi:integrase
MTRMPEVDHEQVLATVSLPPTVLPADARNGSREQVRGDGYLFRYKGSAVWWGKYYIPGNRKPQRFSTGERDQRKAAKVLRQRTGAVRNGGVTPEDIRRRRYDDCEARLFVNYRTNGRRSLPDLERTVRPLRAAFGGMRAVAITTERMRDYSAARLDAGAAPATVNKELGALRRMLTLGLGRKYRDDVPMLHVENTRTGFVEPADFDALVTALPAHLQAPTRFAYVSAWRRGEVLNLTWARVTRDADGGGSIRLDGAQSKNGSGRVLPFVAASPLALLLAEQHERRRLDCPYVFHRNGKPLRYFYDAWRTACKAIGQPHLLFHDLRRSGVRNMVRAGVSEHVAMKRSGHKTNNVFKRYDIVSETDLREADAKVAAYLTTALRAENGQSGRKIVALNEQRGNGTC